MKTDIARGVKAITKKSFHLCGERFSFFIIIKVSKNQKGGIIVIETSLWNMLLSLPEVPSAVRWEEPTRSPAEVSSWWLSTCYKRSNRYFRININIQWQTRIISWKKNNNKYIEWWYLDDILISMMMISWWYSDIYDISIKTIFYWDPDSSFG